MELDPLSGNLRPKSKDTSPLIYTAGGVTRQHVYTRAEIDAMNASARVYADTQRVVILTASSNTYTPDINSTDEAKILSPSADFTIANPTGTPTDRKRLVITITSNSTGRIPTFGSAYISSGIATLPSTALPASKTVTLGFAYDADAAKYVLRAFDSIGY